MLPKGLLGPEVRNRCLPSPVHMDDRFVVVDPACDLPERFEIDGDGLGLTRRWHSTVWTKSAKL